MSTSNEKNRKRARSVKSDIESDNGLSENDIKKLDRLSSYKYRRKVRNTKVLFRAIDILFKRAQNSCPYVNKNDIVRMQCQTDIVYDELHSVCKLDFYRCKSEEKQPAVIIIHGGGFTAGDKKYRRGRAQFFAVNGFSVFVVNYGLAPDYKFPDPFIHIVTAANYIYDRAEEFNIDTDRIFVDGDSAGGYYAAMLAAFNGNERFKEVFGLAPRFRVFGALLNCGVYDMDTVLNTKYPFNLADGVVLSLTGISVQDFDGYEYKDVCEPIEFVTKEFPPSFVIYSDHDVFCKGQGNVLVDKLNELGVYCEYYSAMHATSNHCFSLTWHGEDAFAANELLMSFAKRLAAGKINL